MIDPDVAILSDERVRGSIELPLERGRAERNARKSRTADDHAIEGEVNTLLAERADDIILEFVERDRLSSDRERPEVEKGEFRQTAEAFGDAGRNDTVHGQGVVRIDVEG